MASLKTRLEHCITPIALRSYLAEFISTFIFVFAAVGSTISNSDGECFCFISGGLHCRQYLRRPCQPCRYVWNGDWGTHYYSNGYLLLDCTNVWLCHGLSSAKTTTVGQPIPVHAIPSEMTGFGAGILEGVMTFALVYTVYASSDPRRGAMGAIGPLAIGLIVGANVLASGPFTGGSMNPACSFGAALIGGSFKNHAVYWVGPLIGAAVAGILYDNVVFPVQVPDSLRGISDGVGV
ncbi:hypothetical protein DH2020_044283 [Rehmannia glutinosa]|uniref:Uncharacterized protein n=1 Tax=Rehmannia glutinosa TaxID=99300 RepID=A0ABR0UI71_REHGL